MANPFKEAEERKRQEAEERKRREAAERAKQEKEAQEKEPEPIVTAPVEKVEPVVVVPVQETAPVVPVQPTFNSVEDAASMLRANEDRGREKLEKKVPVNVMIPPSLKRKVEQDIRNKKVKSLSHLITSLLEAYYK